MSPSTQRLLWILLAVLAFASGLQLGRTTLSIPPKVTPTASPVSNPVVTGTATIQKTQVSYAACGRGTGPAIDVYQGVAQGDFIFYRVSKTDPKLLEDDKTALANAETYIQSGNAADLSKALPALIELLQPICVGGLGDYQVLKTTDKNGSSTFDQTAFLDSDKVTDTAFKGRSALVAGGVTSAAYLFELQIAQDSKQIFVLYHSLLGQGDSVYTSYLKPACGEVGLDTSDAQLKTFGSCATAQFQKFDWDLPDDASILGAFYAAATK